MPDLFIKNIGKVFPVGEKKRHGQSAGEICALSGVNLKIESGCFAALVGASGCGKTTLLRMIAGLEHQSEGSVFFDGVCMNDVEPVSRSVSAVFQEYALYPHLNAFDNMAFPMMRKKLDREIIRKTIYQTARSLDIEFLLNRKPRQMSWGQRQRVALGRALCANHSILLLDEPFSGADPNMRGELYRLVQRLQKERKFTCIFATHNLEDVFHLCTDLILMDHGKVLQTGPPEQLFTNPKDKTCASFFANDPYNFLPGRIVNLPKGPAIQVMDMVLIPAAYSPSALQPSGNSIDVGCRSSQIQIVWEPGRSGLRAVLKYKELHPDGNTLYTFEVGQAKIRALARETQMHFCGARASLLINPESVVLFHPETGAALCHERQLS
ncbi:putative sugar ABC transporter ATP-binding protein [Oscillibacter valericigenes Sjm18-20]|nr:putative sugar ABC transporter ATP-binding protein [Oscillibacter valericigenes Sjm18-20]